MRQVRSSVAMLRRVLLVCACFRLCLLLIHVVAEEYRFDGALRAHKTARLVEVGDCDHKRPISHLLKRNASPGTPIILLAGWGQQRGVRVMTPLR